jgi:hypothetical protein
MKLKYRIEWWLLNTDKPMAVINTPPMSVNEVVELIPHGPPGWERYAVKYNGRLLERGDPFGIRGMSDLEKEQPK